MLVLCSLRKYTESGINKHFEILFYNNRRKLEPAHRRVYPDFEPFRMRIIFLATTNSSCKWKTTLSWAEEEHVKAHENQEVTSSQKVEGRQLRRDAEKCLN